MRMAIEKAREGMLKGQTLFGDHYCQKGSGACMRTQHRLEGLRYYRPCRAEGRQEGLQEIEHYRPNRCYTLFHLRTVSHVPRGRTLGQGLEGGIRLPDKGCKKDGVLRAYRFRRQTEVPGKQPCKGK